MTENMKNKDVTSLVSVVVPMPQRDYGLLLRYHYLEIE